MVTLNDVLLLRKPDMNDLEELYLLKNDIESSAYLGGFSTGYSRESIKEWIQFHNKANNEVIYVIQNIANGKLIGHVGLYNIDHRIRKAEFAILIADKNSRGKGYGSLCTEYMIKYGYEQLNLNRIELSLLSTNEKALAIYTKNGFIKEGVLKQSQYKNGRYYDVILMAKFKN